MVFCFDNSKSLVNHTSKAHCRLALFLKWTLSWMTNEMFSVVLPSSTFLLTVTTNKTALIQHLTH